MSKLLNNESVVRVLNGIDPNISPFAFYRQVYKTTPAGVTIGFRIGSEWVYNDELPVASADTLERVGMPLTGICVSSIVEGSDAEVPAQVFVGKFDPKEFWEAVDFVDTTAQWLWHEAHEGLDDEEGGT